MTDEEWQNLIHRSQSGYDEREMEYYRIIAEWEDFHHRDDANIFDVMFRDVCDTISEDGLTSIVVEVSKALGVPVPHLNENAEALAYIKSETVDDHEMLELYYNWEMLKKAGINNQNAFELVVTHELAHRYFKDQILGLCANESWSQELACDYMTGVIACEQNLATGKYKWVVGSMYCSKSHPPGEIRKKVVTYAVEYYKDMLSRNEDITLQNCLDGFTVFMMMNGGEIQRAMGIV
jgi:hypothetical protein